MSDDPNVELWSTAPEGARKGPCLNEACQRTDCLDPSVDRYDIQGEEYSGPFVVMTYTDREHRHWIRINGENVVALPPVPRDEDFARMRDTLRDKHGQMGLEAVENHLQQRSKRAGLPV